MRELRRAHEVFAHLGAERELDATREQLRELGARPPTRSRRRALPGSPGASSRSCDSSRRADRTRRSARRSASRRARRARTCRTFSPSSASSRAASWPTARARPACSSQLSVTRSALDQADVPEPLSILMRPRPSPIVPRRWLRSRCVVCTAKSLSMPPLPVSMSTSAPCAAGRRTVTPPDPASIVRSSTTVRRSRSSTAAARVDADARRLDAPHRMPPEPTSALRRFHIDVVGADRAGARVHVEMIAANAGHGDTRRSRCRA